MGNLPCHLAHHSSLFLTPLYGYNSHTQWCSVLELVHVHDALLQSHNIHILVHSNRRVKHNPGAAMRRGTSLGSPCIS